ncbi:MAG: hypothetical protein FJY55_00705 [Betaproteobacteria bacterium]|nr:hypothetical protein [Betaproteobacteria bacterium]
MSSTYGPTARRPAANSSSDSAITHDDQWWGYNKEHGWVVLDRSLDINKPGLKTQLFFLRCKDKTTFEARRDSRKAPLYVYAPKYLLTLGPELAAEASAVLEGLKARWPELQEKIRKQYQASRPVPVEPPPPPKRVRKAAKKADSPAAEGGTAES